MKKTTNRQLKTKAQIEFPQLCAIVRFILTNLPTIENIDLKETCKERVQSLGFQVVDSATVYRAVDAMEHAYPTLRQEPPIAMPAPAPREERPDPTPVPRPWTKARAGPQTWTNVGEIFVPTSTSVTSSASSKRT